MLILCRILTRRQQRRFLCRLQIDFQGKHFPRCGKHSLMGHSLHKCTYTSALSLRCLKVGNVKPIYLSLPFSVIAAAAAAAISLLVCLLLSGGTTDMSLCSLTQRWLTALLGTLIHRDSLQTAGKSEIKSDSFPNLTFRADTVSRIQIGSGCLDWTTLLSHL